MEERFIGIGELAFILGVNQFTVERWYKFKKENPENEYAKLLPEPVRIANAKNIKTRYWKESDLPALKTFQNAIVPGTKGFMKSQCIYRRTPSQKGGNKDGKKKTGSRVKQSK